eukprot:m.1384241 g.1384241  ORF g.1384241 m.1384241 type:complete len:398 (+) comp24973_c0_seq146:833-2026(+)
MCHSGQRSHRPVDRTTLHCSRRRGYRHVVYVSHPWPEHRCRHRCRPTSAQHSSSLSYMLASTNDVKDMAQRTRSTAAETTQGGTIVGNTEGCEQDLDERALSPSVLALLSPSQFQNQDRIDRLRNALETEFPEASKAYTDAYLNAVLSAPDKKHPKRRRTFVYARDKLLKALRFLKEYTEPSQADEDATELLKCGSLYWYGYDQESRPILWVNPTRKNWKDMDVEAEARMHVYMLEYGIRLMPPGVTSFTVVANCVGLGYSHVNTSLATKLLAILTTGYPDRLGDLYAGPVNIALRSIYSMLCPLMPARLTSKITLMARPAETLVESVLRGGDDDEKKMLLPTFFSGPLEHGVLDKNAEFSWEKMDQANKVEKAAVIRELLVPESSGADVSPHAQAK